MLKGIDPLLSPELLKILCEMGHGEEIVLVDANFTSQTLGQGKPLVRLPGIDLQRASAALLSVFPLDAMVDQPVAFMKVCNTADGYLSAVQRNMLDQIAASGAATPAQCEAVERFAFYERVKGAYAIVQTGEMQPYANFLFKKGVISDPLAA